MSWYDLREYRTLPWVRTLFWFRVGFSVFVAILLGSTVYGVYKQATAAQLSFPGLIGDGLIFLILGLFTCLLILMRAPATTLLIDEAGIRLEFGRGSPDVRTWSQGKTMFRGRYTGGIADSVSRGRSLWSVYGRFGALRETFIPKAAFDDLVSAAKSHGFTLSERMGRPGWTLYTIKR